MRRSRYARASDGAAAERLLVAAAKLIAERGTTTFSFSEVAKVAEVAASLPGQVFGTKVAMLCALVEDFDYRIRHQVLLPAIGDERGLRAIEIALGTVVSGLSHPWPQSRALAILLGEAQGVDAELLAAVNRYHAGLRDTVARWIEEGVEDGDIRPDVRTDAQATIVVAIVRGLLYQMLTDPHAVSYDELAAELTDLLRRALAASPGGD